MRDVLERVDDLVGRGGDGCAWAPSSRRSTRRRGRRARRCWSAPAGSGRQRVRRLRRGRRLRARRGGPRVRRAGPAAVRRQRRRRVRGRASPAAGSSTSSSRRIDRTSFPELGEVAGDIAAGRPVAVATVVAHPDPARVGRRLVVRPEGRPAAGQSRVGAGRRRGGRRRPRTAGGRPHRDVGVRAGRAAARRGDAGVRVVVRAGAADAGVRGDRLRGRGRAARVVPRLPRDGLRRAAGLRDRVALPVRRRGGRRLAAPLPVRRGRGGADRRPDRDLRADPRPEVRRTAAGGRAAAARSRTSARWAPAVPTTTASNGCGRPA